MNFPRKACLPLLLLASCSGSLSDGGRDDKAPDDSRPDRDPPTDDGKLDEIVDTEACSQVRPGAAPMRRLSNAEYVNTLTDLLGDAMEAPIRTATEGFVLETESLGFRNSAKFLSVPPLVAEQYMSAAEAIAVAAASNDSVVDCAAGDNDCAKGFIRDFGLRAYRRPLTDTEAERYDTLFETISKAQGFDAGFEAVLLAMFQSPHFLYRVEHGRADDSTVADGYTRPTAYETASRLSYLFWQSMPDQALFEAARDGELETTEQIRDQALRLLADPRADRVLEFYRQWLDADRMAVFERDKSVFPDLPEDLPELFASELDAFVRHMLFEQEGSLADLLTANVTFANYKLGRHYGLREARTDDFKRIERPEASGILTQSAFLTAHDKQTRTSIVGRGVKLRTDFLCQNVPPPPDGVEVNLEALGDDLSQKERLARHREDAACAGCHALIDPLGVVFEGFDAVGRVRTTDESGAAIDTTSEISSTDDIDGPVADAHALGERFAQSEEVQACFISHTFRFFYGRDHTKADDCSRGLLTKTFKESGHNLQEILLALTQTDTFLYRPIADPEENQ